MTLEHHLHKINKILKLFFLGEFRQLHYYLWIRLHRLDHSHINLVSKNDGQPYSNSGGPRLEKVILSLNIQKKGSTLLEHGVGKGLAAITLSKYFDRVIGVDLSPELITVAERNLTKMKIINVQLYCENAATFSSGIDCVTHVYMFNPFSRSVMAKVMENLTKSLIRNPRKLMIIYLAPYAHEVLTAAGFKHRCDFNFSRSRSIQDRFSIYENL